MSRVYLCFGQSGVGKSTFAASGSGRTWFAELDPGSFDRTGLDESAFTVARFWAPLTNLTERGKVSGAGIARRLKGWDAKFTEFLDAYMNALEADYTDLIIDTSTKLWLMCRNAYFERVQEAKDEKERERLARLEYQEPNAEMDQIIDAAKMMGKNLILVAHEGEIYLNDKGTGKMKPDGYKELPNIADATLQFYLRDKKPVARVYKAGVGGLELIDMEIPEPTRERVDGLVEAAVKLRKAGKAVPSNYDSVLVEAMKIG